MWSDGAVDAWGALVKLALTFNAEATTTVMGVRRWGDADLHLVLWGTCTVVVLWACRTRRQAVTAVLALLIWSGFTELAQPWVTQVRTRQVMDVAGNILGVSLGTVAYLLLRWVRNVARGQMFTKRASPDARTG